MIIGLPREIKDNEYRVAMTPGGILQLAMAGHSILVETHAGEGSGFEDHEYEAAGATIVSNATLPYIMSMAGRGIRVALCEEPALVKGVNVHKGKITYESVARAFDMNYTPLENACLGMNTKD